MMLEEEEEDNGYLDLLDDYLDDGTDLYQPMPMRKQKATMEGFFQVSTDSIIKEEKYCVVTEQQLNIYDSQAGPVRQSFLLCSSTQITAIDLEEYGLTLFNQDQVLILQSNNVSLLEEWFSSLRMICLELYVTRLESSLSSASTLVSSPPGWESTKPTLSPHSFVVYQDNEPLEMSKPFILTQKVQKLVHAFQGYQRKHSL